MWVNWRKADRVFCLMCRKIQSGQLNWRKKEFNIDSLLDETIAAMRMVTSSHEIIRDDHLNNENVVGDRQRIEQVLANFLSNAVKIFSRRKESDRLQ